MNKSIFILFLLIQYCTAQIIINHDEYLQLSEQNCCYTMFENEVNNLMNLITHIGRVVEDLPDYKLKIRSEIREAIRVRIYGEEITTTVSTLTTTVSTIMRKFNSEEENDQWTEDPPESCLEILQMGNPFKFMMPSGVYVVLPEKSATPFKVWCNMDIKGGGWQQFLSRFNGSVDFYRNWAEYTEGFGDPPGEMWLGLQRLHEITNSDKTELLIELVFGNRSSVFRKSEHFLIGNASTDYQVVIFDNSKNFEGLLGKIEHAKFSTYDVDRYLVKDSHCAEETRSGWWFGSECGGSTPTGPFKFGTELVYDDEKPYMYVGKSAIVKEIRMFTRAKLE